MPKKSRKKNKLKEPEKKEAISLERTIYFIPETVPTSQRVFSAVKNICRNFDDVINCLEHGVIDKIIFHPLTNSHTRHYIFQWAKIFNPKIQEQLTTHFPSKPTGSNQVA